MATDIAPPALDDGAHSPGWTFRSLAARLRAFWAPRERQALALILLLAAFTNFYELQRNGYANLYYAAAIRSMLQSWHNFFFVSFDPAGFVSVDKPPLGFWIQAASARLFGYSGFSILLPEALAGVASVAVLYLVVRRVFGAGAGLLAALFLAITPISVVTNRNNTIDSLLVLTSLLAAYAVTRAAEHGSLRWLLLGALLVGLGFNIKMLEAYLIVPALAAVYLLAAPISGRARLGHLALAGVVLLAISLSWVTIVDLTPAALRPYVGSSSTNSELELALGYNGIERLTGLVGQFIGRSAASGATSGGAAVNNGPGGVSENGLPGVFRLLNTQLGGQASWLLGIGAVGLLASGWSLRPLRWLRERQADHVDAAPVHLSLRQGAWLLWGLWTLTQAIFFSVAGFYHTYYLVMLAPSVAALAGIGAVELWRDYRESGWRAWLLPAALLISALVQAVILAPFDAYSAWMTPLVVGVSLLAAAALVWLRLRERRSLAADRSEALIVESDPPPHAAGSARWQMAALSAGLAVALLGPLVWTGVSLARGAGGALPAAGPTATSSRAGAQFASRPRGFGGGFGGGFGRPPFTGGVAPAPPAGGFSGAPPTGGFAGGPAGVVYVGGPSANATLISYLEAHQGSARYLFATTNANSAAPYILATGKAVMALGGFQGSDPILTLSQLQSLIASGQVRYFLLEGAGLGGGARGGSANGALTAWVANTCASVSASASGVNGLYVCGS